MVETMALLANLDMEKKMGFGMKDVDEFLEKAKEVEQKINDIKSGKISVEQLERERELEEREKAEAAAAKNAADFVMAYWAGRLHAALPRGAAIELVSSDGHLDISRALLLLHDALKTRVRLRHPALSGSMAPLLRSAALHAHGSHKLHSKSGSSGVGAAPLI